MEKSQKKIIHFRLPVDKNGEFIIPDKTVNAFVKYIRYYLDNTDYIPLFTPFEVTIADESCAVVKCDEMSIKEFLDRFGVK